MSIKKVLLKTGKSKKPTISHFFNLSVCDSTKVKSCTRLDSVIRCCKFSFQQMNVNKLIQSIGKSEISFHLTFLREEKDLLLKILPRKIKCKKKLLKITKYILYSQLFYQSFNVFQQYFHCCNLMTYVHCNYDSWYLCCLKEFCQKFQSIVS